MAILLAALSALCAIVPMLFFLFVVWMLDFHDREPLWLYLLTFAWGALGGALLSLIGNETIAGLLGHFLDPNTASQLSTVVFAPLVEEPMKALILLLVMFSRHYDNATDGFIYGAAAGLGFGMTENMLYFLSQASTGDAWGFAQLVFLRTFFPAVMHAVCTSAVGAALGFARFRGWGVRIFVVPLGFLCALSIHATWNGLHTASDIFQNELYAKLDFVLFPFEVLAMFGVFLLTVWEERGVIRRELADEVEQGLIPAPHAIQIAGYLSRFKTDWVPKGIPAKQYIRSATTLAIRKHQCRNTSARAYRFYSDEVLRMRREIQALLALAKSAPQSQ